MVVVYLIVLLGVVQGQNKYDAAQALYQFRQEQPREVAIGPWAVWHLGEVQPLVRYPHSRLWVWTSTDTPPQLKFAVEEGGPPLSGSPISRFITVPIPQGHEAEADALVAHFQREIINNPTTLAHPPRQEPAPPPPPAAPAITQRLPPLPPLPGDADTQRLHPRS